MSNDAAKPSGPASQGFAAPSQSLPEDFPAEQQEEKWSNPHFTRPVEKNREGRKYISIESQNAGGTNDLEFIVQPQPNMKNAGRYKPVLVMGVCDESEAIRLYNLYYHVPNTSKTRFQATPTKTTVKNRQNHRKAQAERKKQHRERMGLTA